MPGIPYDEYIFTNIPPRVMGVKNIQVGYYKEHISTIQLTYILQSDGTFIAPVHGTKKDNAANLHLEDGETVIQVTTNRCRSSSLSTDVVKYLSFTTQKKDGTIATYNFSSDGVLDAVR